MNATRLVDMDTLGDWLRAAEGAAKLTKLSGGLGHPYRRSRATARKHYPVKDVAETGGWRKLNTLLTSYTAAEQETMLAVMSEERTVREVVVRHA